MLWHLKAVLPLGAWNRYSKSFSVTLPSPTSSFTWQRGITSSWLRLLCWQWEKRSTKSFRWPIGNYRNIAMDIRHLYMAMGQNPVPLVNIKIAGKWVFIPLNSIIGGFDTHLYRWFLPFESIWTEKPAWTFPASLQRYWLQGCWKRWVSWLCAMRHHTTAWWLSPSPLKNMSQLGWWHSQLNGKI